MGIIIKQIIRNGIIFDKIPEPSAYSVQKSDLYSDATGRSAETGVLLAYLIRRDIYTAEFEFIGKDSEISYIESAIGGSVLEVELLDNGSYVKKSMYPSDRTRVTDIIQNGVGRHRLNFSLIEY